MNKPLIHLYSICWNEERMLPFFFKHYDKFVDRYIFFDDKSDDRTIELINNHPRAEVRPFPESDNNSFVLSAQSVHNSCWKESKGTADWVIITAVDEFLYHPDLIKFLIKCKSEEITAIPALGYQMLSEEFPCDNFDLINDVPHGAPSQPFNKLSLFDPNTTTETNFQKGRHEACPEGKLKYPERDELLNLHFKYLSFDFVFERHKQLFNKLRRSDIKNKWGSHYKFNEEELRNDWNKTRTSLKYNIVTKWDKAIRSHSPKNKRWWRLEEKSRFPFFWR
ncbi:MAG: hypothetical protein APR62_09460 [Smithella sp. SDB]|nr:MAG: hypothetical protein APR62_09460 [Smithella sp. SDB]